MVNLINRLNLYFTMLLSKMIIWDLRTRIYINRLGSGLQVIEFDEFVILSEGLLGSRWHRSS